MRRRERILLFRSGRHLQTALGSLSAAFPGAEITVVATPAARPALDAAGVARERRIFYDATPFFRPFAFLKHAAWRQAAALRPTRVAVMWTAPDGAGHANADRTALTVSPLGFLAVTPDGSIIDRGTASLLGREALRATWSVVAGFVLLFFLFLPARALRLVRS